MVFEGKSSRGFSPNFPFKIVTRVIDAEHEYLALITQKDGSIVAVSAEH
jgi:hypothetical protein